MKTIVEYASLGACLCMLACAAFGSEQGQDGQATAARAAQEVSCQKFIARFRAGASEGLSCQASRERAEREFTTCKLTFNCPKEAWEAGAGDGQ